VKLRAELVAVRILGVEMTGGNFGRRDEIEQGNFETQALNRDQDQEVRRNESPGLKPSLVNVRFHNAVTMLKKSELLEVRRKDATRLIKSAPPLAL
jgi:hypothetical protein